MQAGILLWYFRIPILTPTAMKLGIREEPNRNFKALFSLIESTQNLENHMIEIEMTPMRFPPFRGLWWREVEETERIPMAGPILEHVYNEIERCDYRDNRPPGAVRQSERDQFEALCFAHNIKPTFRKVPV